MGFFIFLLYILIIFLLLSSSRLREMKSNQLLLNLSIGHMITGVSHFAGMWTLFRVGKFVFVGGMYANISLIVLTIDRCIYILKPLHYKLMHPGWHILFMTISPLFALTLFGLYVHTGLNNPVHLDEISTLPFIFFLSVMTVLLFIPSFVVFRIVRRQRSRIASCNIGIPKGQAPREKSRNEERRSFYVCFGCVTTFALLWLPAIVLRIWEIASGLKMKYTYLAISAIFATFNSFSDAVICVWFNKELKKRLRTVLRNPCR